VGDIGVQTKTATEVQGGGKNEKKKKNCATNEKGKKLTRWGPMTPTSVGAAVEGGRVELGEEVLATLVFVGGALGVGSN